MASKRASKAVKNKTSKIKDYTSLTINDVLCPICRTVLIEPVTLPCSHDFCYSCFEGTMENTNLVCPLCRIRIGSWLRRARKTSSLINEELWTTIKNKFPQPIKNKLNGIDENIQEEREINLSFPGEIRKEYEAQKLKVENELRKKREADLKASEELIKKLQEEEDYQKILDDKKIKLDEQVAKELAEELSFIHPSTSTDKKLGPMDRFIKKDNETVTSQNSQVYKKPNNFLTKEYTCRVLRLDTEDIKSDAHKKAFSPIIKKKIQQIQKIVDTDTTSDGSDCIESEMRYFKPIDHRLNPPSQGKSPVKIPSIKALRNAAAKILSPGGLINFHSNILESAFARISLTLPNTILSKKQSASPQPCPIASQLKRLRSEDEMNAPKRKCSKNSTITKKKSPKPNNVSKRLFEKGTVNNIREDTSSPPFYGFENSDVKNNNSSVSHVKANGFFNQKEEEELTRKLLQEKADLELAKKLQEEWNRSVHYTRSTRKHISSKRQLTLDEIIHSPYKVK